MALKYTEEQLNSLDRETLTRLFLSQQEQLENIDHTLQLVLEQIHMLVSNTEINAGDLQAVYREGNQCERT